MNVARIAVLVIALLAGGVAAVLVSGSDPAPAPVVVEQAPTSEVLVAANSVQMGAAVRTEDLAWRSWPEDSAGNFITKSSQPGALDEVAGSIARQPIVGGEPINKQKLVKVDGSGFMSAILPAGMRAVATPISAENGAGGFILPNDRVDVIVTTKAEDKAAAQSQTILTNVRILAIDQTVSEKDGEKSVIGTTATLELLPHQTEILSDGRQQGTISLALRSLSDAKAGGADGGPEDGAARESGSRTRMIRFGVPTN